MKTGKKILIGVVILSVIAIGVVGFLGYQTMTTVTTEQATNVPQVETMEIKNDKTEIVVSGQVKTKETKTEYYDYLTYGKLWDTKVENGQHVNEGDIIVESSKKDYKAQFSGYITELNVQAAYDEAKKAYDDQTMVEVPTILYTIVSDDYYIETSLTEYEVNRLPESKTIKYAIRARDVDTYYDASIRTLAALPTAEIASAATATKTDISNYTLKLNMDSGKELARVGNHVTIRITDANAPVLSIPTTAIVKEDEKTYVYLTTSEGALVTVAKKEIHGREESGKFIVDSGLTTGDMLVTKNVETLNDGATVQVATNGTTTTQNA